MFRSFLSLFDFVPDVSVPVRREETLRMHLFWSNHWFEK